MQAPSGHNLGSHTMVWQFILHRPEGKAKNRPLRVF
jgi:hypothetical protein